MGKPTTDAVLSSPGWSQVLPFWIHRGDFAWFCSYSLHLCYGFCLEGILDFKPMRACRWQHIRSEWFCALN